MTFHSRISTERSPLLPQTISEKDEEEKQGNDHQCGRNILESLSFHGLSAENEDIATPEIPSFSILMEVIGCRNLFDTTFDSKGHFETYCVVQYGLDTVHRTLPYQGHVSSSHPSRAVRLGRAVKQGIEKVGGSSRDNDPVAQALQNPVFTIHHDAVWSIKVAPKDVVNHKAVVIHVWARPLQNPNTLQVSGRRQIQRSHQPKLMGKIRLHLEDLVDHCNEERIEMPLVNELGQEVRPPNTSKEESTIAFRCRIATPADLEFVNHWENHHQLMEKNSPKKNYILRKSQVLPETNLQEDANLLTELPEHLIQGASLSSAIKGSKRQLDGKILVKPYPDPQASVSTPSKRQSPSNQQHMYMTAEQMKIETTKPSRKWVHTGNTTQSFGRLYCEILSAHDLPNVDYAEAMGNKTDAFCSLIYGDNFVQTDIIDDELSPYWLPWTQRAFCFHISQDWKSPSGVALYIGMFGFKRNPIRRHQPIGRVEIYPFHLKRDIVYELEYNLYKDSHVFNRQAQGRVRIRLRLEIDNERAALLAPLSSIFREPEKNIDNIYLNMRTKKSLAVARFTACGECDDASKFSVAVLRGMIDEIVQGYVRRVVYAVTDGNRSLILWQPQDQLRIPVGKGVFVFPLYSMLCFLSGLLMVERPQCIPGMVLCLCGMFMLIQLANRNSSPNPWRRCSSFFRYLRILCGCSSNAMGFEIKPSEGWEETKAEEQALRERMERDRKFLQKKEAVENELRKAETFKIESTSKDLIHLEFLEVLGNVQGIVGGICRLLRYVDGIITWKEGDLAFCITLALLTTGVIFLFLPWSFILHWLGRTLVIVILGPQNRLIDIFYIQKQADDERKLRMLFEKKMRQARYKTEIMAKMRAFRQTVFGKYSCAVPSSIWTPHNDIPLPTSRASYQEAESYHSGGNTALCGGTGQLLFGEIIPRQHALMEANLKKSTAQKESIHAVFALMKSNPAVSQAIVTVSTPTSRQQREPSILLDAGFEVTDLFDEEAQYVKEVMNYPRDESTHELGVEIMPEARLSSRYLCARKSVHDFSEIQEGNDDHSISSSSSIDDTYSPESFLPEKKPPMVLVEPEVTSPESTGRIIKPLDEEPVTVRSHNQKLKKMRPNEVSMVTNGHSANDMGIEITETFEEEAHFVRSSWNKSSICSTSDCVKQFEHQSTAEVGVEIAEEFANEAAFAEQSWRESSSPSGSPARRETS